jgi:hypothetical protein
MTLPDRPPDTPPMQRLLIPNNSDVTVAIRKGQIVVNVSELLCYAYIITCYFVLTEIENDVAVTTRNTRDTTLRLEDCDEIICT